MIFRNLQLFLIFLFTFIFPHYWVFCTWWILNKYFLSEKYIASKTLLFYHKKVFIYRIYLSKNWYDFFYPQKASHCQSGKKNQKNHIRYDLISDSSFMSEYFSLHFITVYFILCHFYPHFCKVNKIHLCLYQTQNPLSYSAAALTNRFSDTSSLVSYTIIIITYLFLNFYLNLY